jgi:hypothetical protein
MRRGYPAMGDLWCSRDRKVNSPLKPRAARLRAAIRCWNLSRTTHPSTGRIGASLVVNGGPVGLSVLIGIEDGARHTGPRGPIAHNRCSARRSGSLTIAATAALGQIPSIAARQSRCADHWSSSSVHALSSVRERSPLAAGKPSRRPLPTLRIAGTVQQIRAL